MTVAGFPLRCRARTIGALIALDVVHSEVVRIRKAQPSTLFGKGQVERLAATVAALELLVGAPRGVNSMRLFLSERLSPFNRVPMTTASTYPPEGSIRVQ